MELGNRDTKIFPSSHEWWRHLLPAAGMKQQHPPKGGRGRLLTGPLPDSQRFSSWPAASLPSRAVACQVGQDPTPLPVARLCGSAADLQRAGLHAEGWKLPCASWPMAKAAPSPNQSQKILWRFWLQLETKCKIIEVSSCFFHKISKLKKVL